MSSSLTALNQPNTSSLDVKVENIAPSVTILHPVGGELIQNFTEINWTSTDTAALDSGLTISIEYSSDGGSTWNSINSSTENDGEYNWNSSTVGDGNNYRIRVNSSDSAGNINSSISSSSVTISNYGPIIHDVSLNTSNVSGPFENVELIFNITRTGASIDECWGKLTLHDGNIEIYSGSQVGNNDTELLCIVETTVSQVGNFNFTPYTNDTVSHIITDTPQVSYRWDHVSIEHIYGNDSGITRAGNEEAELVIRVYDTDTSQYIHSNDGSNTADTCLYVTTDGSNYNLVESNSPTDSCDGIVILI